MAKHEGDCFIWTGIRVLIPGQVLAESSAEQRRTLSDTASRLGATSGLSLSEGLPATIEDGWPFVLPNEVRHGHRLLCFYLTVQEPSPFFFLHAAAHTDRAPEQMPSEFQPDAEGYLHFNGYNFYDLIWWVYALCTFLDIRVDKDLNEFVRHGHGVRAGGAYADRAIRHGYSLRNGFRA